MRLLVAPNAFKGTFSSLQAANAIRRGLQRSLPHASLDLMPLADGGPGTLACVPGRLHTLRVLDALGRPREAHWKKLRSGQALVESAEAIGLASEKKRDALAADSYGLGQLVLAAGRSGARILLGLGGSATTDGGSGMARALGWRFLDAKQRDLPPGGGHLGSLHSIVPPPRRRSFPIDVLCDVDNPLLGAEGAARVYGPQKGASPSQVRRLETGLRRLAGFFPKEWARHPGTGAAGGLGFGLMAFCGGRLIPGASTLLSLNRFEARLARADAVVSGEGRLDRQSLRGKLPLVVARHALAAQKPCALICGSVEHGLPLPPGITVLPLRGRSLADRAEAWGRALQNRKARVAA